MNRVLLDQGLAPKAAVILREEGWDAVHVMEVGLANAEDTEILEFAGQNRRVCITFDHDFHAHLALARANGPSVMLIRVEGLDSSGQAGTDSKGLGVMLGRNRCGCSCVSG